MADKTLHGMINTSLQKGSILSLGKDIYQLALKEADNPDLDLVLITITTDLTLPPNPSLSNLTGLLGGNFLGSLIPPVTVPTDGVALDIASVGFTLNTQVEKISEVNALVLLNKSKTTKGINLISLEVGNATVNVTLDSVYFQCAAPGSPIMVFTATLNGSATIGDNSGDALVLDASVTFPGGIVSIREPSGSRFNISKFFKHVGLSLPIDIGLSLSDFECSINPGAKSLHLEGALTLQNGSLIDGVLTLEKLYLIFSHYPRRTIGTVRCSLLIEKYLALDIGFTLNTGQNSWQLSGNINIPATCKNLNVYYKKSNQTNRIIKPVNYSYALPVTDLADIFISDWSQHLPSALHSLSIALLIIDYSYSKGNSTFELTGEVDGHWNLDGNDLKADVKLHLQYDSSQSPKWSGKVSADFVMDGFHFNLACQFGTSQEIQASISDTIGGKKIDICGSYNESKHKLTLNFKHTPSLATLMSWFVGELTGNKYFELPDPWDTILGEFKIPDGTTLTIDTKTKAVSCTLHPDIDHFGIKISSITIRYARPKTGPKEDGLKIKLTGTFPWTSSPISWNPATEQPQNVPGRGASIIDIDLIAAGQHVEIMNQPRHAVTGWKQPDTVGNAVKDIELSFKQLSSAPGTFPEGLEFSKSAGWLLGAHATFLGQADVQFIFLDPLIYGLKVDVTTSKSNKKNNKLDLLAGLQAEILYRKVNKTVGEYAGSLTLPTKIRKIQYGTVHINLPSISVSIYTNGDFSFDIGFPHNLDFSHSFSVSADSFAGAGGFYYAKLNGLDPKSLPKITGKGGGVFNPVTEIGIGFRVGREIFWHSGPLSASASVMLEGLFQGVFAKYVSNNQAHEGEYYSIKAVLEVIGHIKGEVNFAIVKASLDVTAYIKASLKLTAYQKTQAKVTATVSVSITVSISLGLFSIHIHCHFSTTFHTQASFGTDRTAEEPWTLPKSTGSVFDEVAVGMSEAPVVASGRWQALTTTSKMPLQIDILPQATRDGSGQWYYIAQFAMNLDETVSSGQNTSYKNFITGIVTWALNSASTTPETTYSAALANKVTRNQIETLSKNLSAYSNNANENAPTESDLKALFTGLFQATISKPDTSVKQYRASFFPAFPGTTVDVTAGTITANSVLETALVKDHFGDTSFSEVQGMVLSDFIVLTLTNALKTALDGDAVPTDSTLVEISKIIQSLDKGLDSIAGQTTRFMLHGTRYNSSSLYSATGQQQPFSPLAISDNLLIHVSCPAGVWWDGAACDINLLTTDKTPIIFRPNQFTGHTLNTSEFTSLEILPAHKTVDKHFPITSGINTDKSSSIWHLPSTLINGLLSGKITPTDCTLWQVKPDTNGHIHNGKPTPIVDASWVMTVDFKIKKIPLPQAPGKGTEDMSNTYQLGMVNQLGLIRLEQLIGDIQAYKKGTLTTASVASLDISYTNGKDSTREANLLSVDDTNVFMMQSNFSTQTNPPNGMFLEVARGGPSSVDMSGFIYKIWTGGITNSGGYFLYCKGLPKTSFDGNGIAAVSLVITLTGRKKYMTGVMLEDAVNSYDNLYVAESGKSVTHATLPPGKLGLRLTRTAPPPPISGNLKYGNTLDHLYNIITATLTNMGTSTKIHDTYERNTPVTISPKNKSQQDLNTWYYDHVFKCIPAFAHDGSGKPPSPMNPYQYVGTAPEFTTLPTDLFGNQWDALNLSLPTGSTISYTDPVISLKQLPYLHIDYTFGSLSGSNGNPPIHCIFLNFNFDMPTYGNGSGDIPLSHRVTDCEVYAKAIWQLSNNTKASISTTFTSQVNDTDLEKKILTILNEIYTTLDTKPAPPPSTITKNISVPIKGDINAQVTFPLSVSLIIKRTNYVDTAFRDNPAVTSSTVQLPPQMVVHNSTSKQNDLKPFATNFETIFSGMKLAVGVIDNSGAQVNDHQIWVVRFGTGNIEVAFNQSIYYYYAPKPLSNKLQSRDKIAVDTLTSSFTIDSSTTSSVSANNVDLDAEMRAFLKEIDTMFTPEMFVNAAIISPSAVSALSTAKQKLALKFTDYVKGLDPNSIGSAEALRSATEMYRQECLIELSNFYKMSSVAIVKTNANSNLASSFKMNFLGTPQAAGVDDHGVTMTTGKAPIATSSQSTYMPIGIFPKKAREQSFYHAKLNFHLTALEHNFRKPIELGGSTYELGSWLKFVKNPSSIPIGSVDIPIPLRTFPSTPRLDRQYATDLANIESSADQNTLMELAKSWSLNGSYHHHFVAQDSLSLTVDLGKVAEHHSGTSTHGKSHTKDLLDTLVQFKTLYPQLKAELDKIRAEKDPSPKQTNMSNALESFATLVGDVADCSWDILGSNAGGSSGGGPPQPAKPTSKFEILEGVDSKGFPLKPEDPWRAIVSMDGPSNELGFFPQLQIPGYETVIDPSKPLPTNGVAYHFTTTEGKGYLLAHNAEFLSKRIVAAAPVATDIPSKTPLNILMSQTGNLTMQIIRNKELPTDFWYTTPEVTYKSPLSPLLVSDTVINMAGLGVANGVATNRTLDQHLIHFFDELLKSYTTPQGEEDGYFQTVVTFNYPSTMSQNFSLQPISIPITFRLSTAVSYGSQASPISKSTYVSSLNAIISHWIKSHYGTVDKLNSNQNILGSWFNFDISLFSSKSATGDPILRLKRVELPSKYILP